MHKNKTKKTENFFFSVQKRSSPLRFPFKNSLTCRATDLNSLNEFVFLNSSFDKNSLKTIVSWFFEKHGQYKTLKFLEKLKEFGFGFATKAGISLGIDDLRIPNEKISMLATAETKVAKDLSDYRNSKITGIERVQRFMYTWNQTNDALKQEVVKHFEQTDLFNPIYMMAFSGARGNMSQVRQLVGMRGLMSDPQGQIIDFPIQSNFREGLTLTEYLISTYGARKGIVDTALRTATAGYLTRRLVDVAQHTIVSHFDCGTMRGIFLFDMKEGKKTIYSFQNRLIGRVLAQNISLKFSETQKQQKNFLSPDSEEQILDVRARRNQEIDSKLARALAKVTKKAFVRSPLTCETARFVCQLCYGWSFSYGKLVSVGEAVGIIAAQSIGEPGTQLTMRTFHTGGVFAGGLTDQILAPFDGRLQFFQNIPGSCVRTSLSEIAFFTKMPGSFFIQKKRENDLFQPDASGFASEIIARTAPIPRSSLCGASEASGAVPSGEAWDAFATGAEQSHAPLAALPALPSGWEGWEPWEKREYSFFHSLTTKETNERFLEFQNKSKKEKKHSFLSEVFRIPAYALLFCRNNEFVQKKQVLAQFSSVLRKVQYGSAEQTLFSTLAGEFVFGNSFFVQKKAGFSTSLDILRDSPAAAAPRFSRREVSGAWDRTTNQAPESLREKGKEFAEFPWQIQEQQNLLLEKKHGDFSELELKNDILWKSQNWSKIWILSGKIFYNSFDTKFWVRQGDFLKKTSVLNRIIWKKKKKVQYTLLLTQRNSLFPYSRFFEKMDIHQKKKEKFPFLFTEQISKKFQQKKFDSFKSKNSLSNIPKSFAQKTKKNCTARGSHFFFTADFSFLKKRNNFLFPRFQQTSNGKSQRSIDFTSSKKLFSFHPFCNTNFDAEFWIGQEKGELLNRLKTAQKTNDIVFFQNKSNRFFTNFEKIQYTFQKPIHGKPTVQNSFNFVFLKFGKKRKKNVFSSFLQTLKYSNTFQTSQKFEFFSILNFTKRKLLKNNLTKSFFPEFDNFQKISLSKVFEKKFSKSFDCEAGVDIRTIDLSTKTQKTKKMFESKVPFRHSSFLLFSKSWPFEKKKKFFSIFRQKFLKNEQKDFSILQEKTNEKISKKILLKKTMFRVSVEKIRYRRFGYVSSFSKFLKNENFQNLFRNFSTFKQNENGFDSQINPGKNEKDFSFGNENFFGKEFPNFLSSSFFKNFQTKTSGFFYIFSINDFENQTQFQNFVVFQNSFEKLKRFCFKIDSFKKEFLPIQYFQDILNFTDAYLSFFQKQDNSKRMKIVLSFDLPSSASRFPKKAEGGAALLDLFVKEREKPLLLPQLPLRSKRSERSSPTLRLLRLLRGGRSEQSKGSEQNVGRIRGKELFETNALPIFSKAKQFSQNERKKLFPFQIDTFSFFSIPSFSFPQNFHSLNQRRIYEKNFSFFSRKHEILEKNNVFLKFQKEKFACFSPIFCRDSSAVSRFSYCEASRAQDCGEAAIRTAPVPRSSRRDGFAPFAEQSLREERAEPSHASLAPQREERGTGVEPAVGEARGAKHEQSQGSKRNFEKLFPMFSSIEKKKTFFFSNSTNFSNTVENFSNPLEKKHENICHYQVYTKEIFWLPEENFFISTLHLRKEKSFFSEINRNFFSSKRTSFLHLVNRQGKKKRISFDFDGLGKLAKIQNFEKMKGKKKKQFLFSEKIHQKLSFSKKTNKKTKFLQKNFLLTFQKRKNDKTFENIQTLFSMNSEISKMKNLKEFTNFSRLLPSLRTHPTFCWLRHGCGAVPRFAPSPWQSRPTLRDGKSVGGALEGSGSGKASGVKSGRRLRQKSKAFIFFSKIQRNQAFTCIPLKKSKFLPFCFDKRNQSSSPENSLKREVECSSQSFLQKEKIHLKIQPGWWVLPFYGKQSKQLFDSHKKILKKGYFFGRNLSFEQNNILSEIIPLDSSIEGLSRFENSTKFSLQILRKKTKEQISFSAKSFEKNKKCRYFYSFDFIEQNDVGFQFSSSSLRSERTAWSGSTLLPPLQALPSGWESCGPTLRDGRSVELLRKGKSVEQWRGVKSKESENGFQKNIENSFEKTEYLSESFQDTNIQKFSSIFSFRPKRKFFLFLRFFEYKLLENSKTTKKYFQNFQVQSFSRVFSFDSFLELFKKYHSDLLNCQKKEKNHGNGLQIFDPNNIVRKKQNSEIEFLCNFQEMYFSSQTNQKKKVLFDSSKKECLSFQPFVFPNSFQSFENSRSCLATFSFYPVQFLPFILSFPQNQNTSSFQTSFQNRLFPLCVKNSLKNTIEYCFCEKKAPFLNQKFGVQSFFENFLKNSFFWLTKDKMSFVFSFEKSKTNFQTFVHSKNFSQTFRNEYKKEKFVSVASGEASGAVPSGEAWDCSARSAVGSERVKGAAGRATRTTQNFFLKNGIFQKNKDFYGSTKILSPFEGELLSMGTHEMNWWEKASKISTLQKFEKLHTIITKKDLFAVEFLKENENFQKETFERKNFSHSSVGEPPQEETASLKGISEREGRSLRGKQQNFEKLYEILLLSNKKVSLLNFQKIDDFFKTTQISSFVTKYERKVYNFQNLRIGSPLLSKIPSVGNFVFYGDCFLNAALRKPGQIVHMNSKRLTLRRGQPFFVSFNGVLHFSKIPYIRKNVPVVTLPYQTVQAGDIVQGIPKVEQYFEARTTIQGRLFVSSLPILLKGIFERYKTLLPLEQATRQSFLKIQQILVDGVQRVYRSQGVSITDKHLEIVVRQMTTKVQILHGAQTGFFPGELVNLDFVERLNKFLMVKIRYEPVILGITRASLEVESFLSASSFQQTTKILSLAAISQKKDFLKGLKENLFVGNLIPAGTGYFTFTKNH